VAGAPPAASLLAASDRARGGLERGVTWTVELEATEEGSVSRSTHLVRARGTDALVEALSPPRRKGEVMLFNDRNIWFVKPGLRRPVAISARQRLQGQAANGDIASTNYARDYTGTVVGEELDFVSRMIIRDAMGAGDVTVLGFRSPRAETHAPSLFNVNNVVR
jgi:hypothetical protein